MLYLNEIRLRSEPEDAYLAKIPAVQWLMQKGSLSFSSPVTFFVGENGTGKSTLLEAIAVALGFNAEGGSREHSFSTNDTHSDLGEHLSAIRSHFPKDGFFLRAESFYNFAAYLDDSGSLLTRFGGRSLNAQSHGESFLTLVNERFTGHGIYLLDEPEAALSPQRLLSLLVSMDDLVKEDSQFLIATHSPILMAYPDAEILQFSDSGIAPVSYRETEHYRVMHDFMEDPERMLHYLLER